MLLTKSVQIKGSTKNITHYRNMGYIFKINEIVDVNIKHISYGYDGLVEVCCDSSVCGCIKKISYKDYYKSTNGLVDNYYCTKCKYLKTKQTNIEKYGVENVSQLEVIKEKKKNTFIENYGVENYSQTDEFKENLKILNLEKYGVEYYLQTEDKQIKSKKTCIDKYGTEHANQSDIVKDKIKETNIERYGVDYPSMLESFKENIKANNLEKYGSENYFLSNDFKVKSKKTIFEKYGVENVSQSKIVRDKIISNSNEKYGVDYVQQSDEYKDRIKKNNLIKLNKTYREFFINNKEYNFINYTRSEIELEHISCGTNFSIDISNYRNRNYANNILCTECFPISGNKSIKEKEVINWLKELNFEILESDKKFLEGKELDIYLTSHNLAIEFNGLYWHSELFKEKDYHLNKSIMCQDKGIHLLHIWEDEWIFKREIVKSIIINRLGKIENKIFARKCYIKEVKDDKLVRKFLDTNHIQGFAPSSTKLGLYFNDELVSLMTFGKRMIKSNVEFELIRFCNKINFNIIGASSKLFKYFLNNFVHTTIVSYSDMRLFDGKMYENLGFEKIHLSVPEYYWIKNIERHHRSKFMKHKLVEQGYDPNKTEVEIMHERGYKRIWGCGQVRWEYKNNENEK